jgi:hypothetical protein
MELDLDSDRMIVVEFAGLFVFHFLHETDGDRHT